MSRAIRYFVRSVGLAKPINIDTRNIFLKVKQTTRYRQSCEFSSNTETQALPKCFARQSPFHEEVHKAVPDVWNPGGFRGDANSLEYRVVLILRKEIRYHSRSEKVVDVNQEPLVHDLRPTICTRKRMSETAVTSCQEPRHVVGLATI